MTAMRAVQFECLDLFLTVGEYAALKRLSFDAPDRALDMARGLVAAQSLDPADILDTYCPNCSAAPGTPCCDLLGVGINEGFGAFHRARGLLLARRPA